MTYEFQSTSNARLILVCIVGTLVLSTFLIGSILLIDSFAFFKSYEQVVIVSLSIVGIGIFWLIGKKFLKQESKLILNDDSLIFIRDGQSREFLISEIESYKYKLVKGVRLSFWTRRNENISIIANDAFCEYEDLERFCSDFDNHIKSLRVKPNEANSEQHSKYGSVNRISLDTAPKAISAADSDSEQGFLAKGEITKSNTSSQLKKELPERKKSFYERRYAQPFLIVFTILVVAFVVYVKVDGGNLPATIIVGAGGLAAMWAGYFNHQKK